jgi:hypothetical protein
MLYSFTCGSKVYTAVVAALVLVCGSAETIIRVKTVNLKKNLIFKQFKTI